MMGLHSRPQTARLNSGDVPIDRPAVPPFTAWRVNNWRGVVEHRIKEVKAPGGPPRRGLWRAILDHSPASCFRLRGRLIDPARKTCLSLHGYAPFSDRLFGALLRVARVRGPAGDGWLTTCVARPTVEARYVSGTDLASRTVRLTRERGGAGPNRMFPGRVEVSGVSTTLSPAHGRFRGTRTP